MIAWSHLQSLVARAPEGAAWLEVCDWLDGLHDDVVTSELDQIDVRLAAWPVCSRIVPVRWVERLCAVGREVRTRVCRVLSMSWATSAELWRTLDSPDVASIEHVFLTAELARVLVPDLVQRVARSKVRRLSITGTEIEEGVAPLLELPLDALGANICGLGHGVLAKVAASVARVRVTELSLELNVLGAADLEHLVRVPGIGAVHALSLSGNKFLAAGAHVLAQHWPGTALDFLGLETTQVGDAGTLDLARLAIARLDLKECLVGDRGAIALAGSSVRELDLRNNHVTAQGAAALLASPTLRWLDLSNNDIDDQLVAAITHVSPSLEYIALDDANLGAEAATALEADPRLAKALALDRR